MRYDPILCMMVDDSVNTKDAAVGSVQEYYDKMVGKTKAEVEKIVMNAKGNPNADLAYKKWLNVHSRDNKTIDKAIRSCDKEYVTMTYRSWKHGNMVKEFRSKNEAFEYVRKNRVKEGITNVNISGRYYALNEIDPSVDKVKV